MSERFLKPTELYLLQAGARKTIAEFDAWCRENYPDEDNHELMVMRNCGTSTIAWTYLHKWMTER